MIVRGTNLSMIKGDSEAIKVVLNSKGTQVPFSDGDTVFFTMRKQIPSEDIIIQKIITDFQRGAALIQLDPSDTENLPSRLYFYDVQITFASGEVKTVVRPSEFRLEEGVTRE